MTASFIPFIIFFFIVTFPRLCTLGVMKINIYKSLFTSLGCVLVNFESSIWLLLCVNMLYFLLFTSCCSVGVFLLSLQCKVCLL